MKKKNCMIMVLIGAVALGLSAMTASADDDFVEIQREEYQGDDEGLLIAPAPELEQDVSEGDGEPEDMLIAPAPDTEDLVIAPGPSDDMTPTGQETSDVANGDYDPTEAFILDGVTTEKESKKVTFLPLIGGLAIIGILGVTMSVLMRKKND
jgi:hypothetical protein